ncbi:hypothetical protein AMATHDRAFT_70634 [Amanita thiersii Skay4041]|uniref:Uncharacterized protein n=1 Tax=Amanita thiersii Skay4041 TaxID=703135 RepID=A0A2A9NEN3_9AGAR|nr:hypothetical protein AMATHDRAFT_70634 [Amanita thiersii Skay4041]
MSGGFSIGDSNIFQGDNNKYGHQGSFNETKTSNSHNSNTTNNNNITSRGSL